MDEAVNQTHPVSSILSDNERLVADLVWRHGSVSRSEMAPGLPFTQQSTHRIIDALEKKGVLKIGPAISSGRGKPSPVIQICANGYYSVGLSIIHRGIYFCIIDLVGNVIVNQRVEVDNQYCPETLDAIKSAIFNTIKEQGIALEKVLGCGISVPTYRSHCEQGEFIYQAFRGWPSQPYGSIFSGLLGMPVWVENSANCYAMAELMKGESKYTSFVYISLEFGYGSGLIWKGELLQGGFGNAGEIGRLYHDSERINRPAMSILLDELKDHGIYSMNDLDRNFSDVQPLVEKWVERAKPYFTLSLRAYTGIFDPQAIVIGGNAPIRIKQYFENIANDVLEKENARNFPLPDIYISNIDKGGDTLGAALLMLKERVFL